MDLSPKRAPAAPSVQSCHTPEEGGASGEMLPRVASWMVRLWVHWKVASLPPTHLRFKGRSELHLIQRSRDLLTQWLDSGRGSDPRLSKRRKAAPMGSQQVADQRHPQLFKGRVLETQLQSLLLSPGANDRKTLPTLHGKPKIQEQLQEQFEPMSM